MFFTGNPSPPTTQRAKFEIDFKGNKKMKNIFINIEQKKRKKSVFFLPESSAGLYL